MNLETIIDDVLIFKKRSLIEDERQEIMSEIKRVQDEIKPLGVYPFNMDTLGDESDKTLVTILMYQYKLFAIKFFYENSRKP